jgi:hypothetical protein
VESLKGFPHNTSNSHYDHAPRFGNHGGRIPKGFRNKAQGCEERATLGKRFRSVNNPERVAARGDNNSARPEPPLGLNPGRPVTQGSSFLATWALRRNPFGILLVPNSRQPREELHNENYWHNTPFASRKLFR